MAYENGKRVNHHKAVIKGKGKQKKIRDFFGNFDGKYWVYPYVCADDKFFRQYIKRATTRKLRKIGIMGEDYFYINRSEYKKIPYKRWFCF